MSLINLSSGIPAIQFVLFTSGLPGLCTSVSGLMMKYAAAAISTHSSNFNMIPMVFFIAVLRSFSDFNPARLQRLILQGLRNHLQHPYRQLVVIGNQIINGILRQHPAL